MKRMFNNFIRCRDTEDNKERTSSGFETNTENKFKKVTVVTSGEEDVAEGDDLLVPVGAGEKDPYDDNIVFIRRQEIIYIF